MVTVRKWWAVVAAGLLTVGLAGCNDIVTETADGPTTELSSPPPAVTEAPEPEPTTPSPSPSAAPVTFVSVIDGDTVETSEGTVRLIGIDTPERGECGHDEASMAIGRLVAPGDEIELVFHEGQNDSDAYDRLLRFVLTTDGVDLGLMQLEAGNAVARYDSSDGYPEHPREAEYHAAQTARLGDDGVVNTITCQVEAEEPSPEPAPGAVGDQDEELPWYMNYRSCSHLKKNTVGDPTGPFDVNDPDEVEIYNWFQYGTGHRGDGDGDGLACE